MATFALVHGAWQGASTWDPVIPKLQGAGHQVYVPTHRLTPDVTLDVHIQDVLGVINFERLQDVTLVGHRFRIDEARKCYMKKSRSQIGLRNTGVIALCRSSQ